MEQSGIISIFEKCDKTCNTLTQDTSGDPTSIPGHEEKKIWYQISNTLNYDTWPFGFALILIFDHVQPKILWQRLFSCIEISV